MFSSATELAQAASRIIQGTNPDSGAPDASADIRPRVEGVVVGFSSFYPRKIRVYLSGDSTGKLALPAEWDAGFSQIEGVEYPLETGVGDGVRLDRRAYRLWPGPENATHLLLSSAPTSGSSNVGLDITVPHSVTDGDPTQAPPDDAPVNTIPMLYQSAVEYLLAEAAAVLMATRMGYTVDPAIEADSVNYRSKGAEWAERAKAFHDAAARECKRLSGEPMYGPHRQGWIPI